MAGGINVNNITRGTDTVTLSWVYRREMTLEGYVDPVINPTDIVVHVVFTYNGETYSADISAPMIVQKAAASVLAQYSADGTNWEDSFKESHGHIYVRYSYDGGTTWTAKIRIVGKSIEFSRAITLYATYAAMVADDPRLDGVYLCNTDSSTPTPRRKATAWQKSGNTYTQISITDEVNYLTSSEGLYPTTDGHLFNADSASTEWADLGVIQGADGVDGISVTLDPATVIFEQNEDNIDTFTPSPSSFTATVNVWKGTTPLASNSYKVAIQSTTNCTATISGNQITSLTLSKDSQNVYYPSGSVVLGVWLDPTSTSQTPDTTLTFNWAANLLGTWKASVEAGTYTAIASQTVAMYDANGNLTSVPLSSIFEQSSNYILLSVLGLKGKTGINVADGLIDLFADKVRFRKSQENAGDEDDAMIWIDAEEGTLHAVNGDFQGTLTAKNYLVDYADLITYYLIGEGKVSGKFLPGEDTVAYDDNDNELDISSYWYFMLDDMQVFLPSKKRTQTENLIGQRIVLYNPHLGTGQNRKDTYVYVTNTVDAEQEWVYEDIRGVGLPAVSEYPLIDEYVPVKTIRFCNGVVELQCVPSSDPNCDYEWCVVNIGTNIMRLYDSYNY